MSVVKSKRKESDFEVFHHFYKMRKEITDLLLRDFGYRNDRAERRLLRNFGGKSYGELSPKEIARYEKLKVRNASFDDWFIEDMRQCVMDCLRNICEEIFVANSVYPTCVAELEERRLHQDRAIGQCHRLKQELQYAIETLPVDVNKFLRFSDLIEIEINLIKGWRKSDNKFKKGFIEETDTAKEIAELLKELVVQFRNRATSDSAANFANCNDNGNANYNNASNSNGVRPDFDAVIE